VVLAGQVPGEVLAAATRSLNVTLYRPEAPAESEDGDRGGDSLAAAAAALQRAGRSASPYALVPADPLAAVAARWQEMWDLSKQPGPAAFELEAAQAPSRARTSTSGRCARSGRTGWCWFPRPSPPSRPPASCMPSARCGTAPGGRAWTR
jgi:hypothetical protein